MMDCLTAQEILSASLDGEPISNAALDEANAHCLACESCSAFQRVQLALDMAPAPEPPADLADRVMARLRTEIAPPAAEEAEGVATGVGRDAALEAASQLAPDGATAPPEGRGLRVLLGMARDPRNRKAVAIWASAAAMLLVAIGIGAVAGVNAMFSGAESATDSQGAFEESITTNDARTSGDVGTRGQTSGDSDPGVGAPVQKPTGTANFITINGVVYRLDGRAGDVDLSEMDEIGTTRSSLDRSGPVREWEVLGKQGLTRVYIEADRDDTLAFVPVMRAYGGRAYELRSAPISAFGEWPSLPSGMREPSSSDGSPTFSELGPDDLGVTVYVRSGAEDAEEGLAVAPKPPASDPIAGCPEWTWWVPTR